MKLEEYLNEGLSYSRHKIDFFSRWGYIGSSNGVHIDNTANKVMKELRYEKDLMSYMAIILIEESGFKSIADKLARLLDNEMKDKK